MCVTVSGQEIWVLTCACLISLFALQFDLVTFHLAPALEVAQYCPS